MKVMDGWFEEREDGGRDYIAVCENGEIWRCENVYWSGFKIEGLDYSGGEETTIELTVRYDKEGA